MKIEIVHDLLAKYVFEQASGEDKARLRAENIVRSRYQYYQQDQSLLLSAEDMAVIAPYKEDISLTRVEQQFLKASQQQVIRQQHRIRNRNYAILALSIVILLLPVSMIGWYNAHLAQDKAHRAEGKTMAVMDSLETAVTQANSYRKVIESGEDAIEVVSWEELESEDMAAMRTDDMRYATIQISGQVLNEYNRPVSNATIRLMGAEISTNKRGRFNTFIILPPLLISKQDFPLEVKKEGYQVHTQNVETQAEINLDIKLNPLTE